MPRTLKTLGLALLGTLAIAAGAPTAQAKPFFEADKYKATIDGTATAESVFTFGIYKFKCKNSKMLGELFVVSEALKLTAEYTECTWTPGITGPPEEEKPSVVFITMNGCNWRLHGLEILAKDEYLSLADLECPTGKQVVIDLYHATSLLCTLTVAVQSNKSDVKLIDQTGKEETSDDDVKAQITVEKMRYTQDLITCPVKQGTYENLQYLGENTLTATNEEGKQIGLRVSGV